MVPLSAALSEIIPAYLTCLSPTSSTSVAVSQLSLSSSLHAVTSRGCTRSHFTNHTCVDHEYDYSAHAAHDHTAFPRLWSTSLLRWCAGYHTKSPGQMIHLPAHIYRSG